MSDLQSDLNNPPQQPNWFRTPEGMDASWSEVRDDDHTESSFDADSFVIIGSFLLRIIIWFSLQLSFYFLHI